MTNVVPIKRHALYRRQPKRSAAGVLRDVRALNPKEVLIIAVEDDGNVVVQGSPPDPGNAFWLMELARNILTGVSTD